jgi:hypothetical protein
MSTLERLALFFGWLALTASGAAWLFLNAADAAKSTGNDASDRAGAFVAFMTAICTIAPLAYASKNIEVSGGSDPPADRILAAIKTSLIWHLGLGLPCVLMLDGGRSSHVAIVAGAAYWPMVFLIVLRRAQAPTKLDLIAIRHGYPFVFLAVAGFGPTVWARMGRAP